MTYNDVLTNVLNVKDGHEDLLNVGDGSSSGMIDINVASAIMFVVVASCFLIMLYKLMSYWFVELLVVIFCIGGVEVQFCQVCSFTFVSNPHDICFLN